MKDLKKILGKLTEEEKKIVLELLGEEPAPKKDKPKKTKKPKKPKVKKPRKNRKRLDKSKDAPIIEQGRKSRRKRVLLDENDEIEPPKMSVQGRAQSRSGGQNQSQPRGQQGGKGMQAMSERYDTSGGRENKFLHMPEFKKAKGDVKRDKILSGDNTPVLRRDAFEPIEIQCTSCSLWYDVSPDLVYKDPDNGLVYKCNRCGGR